MIEFPEYATQCIEKITEKGFEAYFVGGCVRDGLLGRISDDIDIATSALPDEIMSLFPNSVPTGIKHGTVTVLINNNAIEVTTYRQEFGYKDSRHPNTVNYVTNLEEDLSRRDFTINSHACSKSGRIIDLFGGMSDLKNGIIKAVGEPKKRFEEDALRIIRAYRFASVLGFKIEEKTKEAAIILSHNLGKISGERIAKELEKSASGSNLSVISELISTGALNEFGILSHNHSNMNSNYLSSAEIDNSSKLSIIIALCEHDMYLIKNRLKADNNLTKKISTLDKLKTCGIPKSKAEVKKLLYWFSYSSTELYFHYLMTLNALADDKLFVFLKEIHNNNEPYQISHLAVDGNDLLELGYQGVEIKNALEKLLFSVIDGKTPNTKHDLLNHLKN